MPHEISDFEHEVIQRSHEVPVLVDFWAEWCAPCRLLGPVLERLAAASGGTWILAKVNTENHQDVAIRYDVRSIPNVKLFIDGAVAGEFVGALPDYAIRQWLQKYLPGKHRKALQEAAVHLESGRMDDARQILEQVNADEPGNGEAGILLAKILLRNEPQRAEKLLLNIEDPRFTDLRDALITFVKLLSLQEEDDLLPDAPVRAIYRSGVRALHENRYDAALECFIEVIRQDRYYNDDGARKACLAVFKYLGEEHPTTLKYRRDFSRALYM